MREFRGQTADHMDNSLLRDCLRSLDKQSDDDGYIGIPRELKLALMEDHDVIITPVKCPPSPKDVREWMKARGTGNQIELLNTPRVENSGNFPEENINIQVSGKPKDVIHSPKLADPNLDVREISQLSQGVSQNISRDVLLGPQHSTPVGNPRIKSRKFWQCTPIQCDEAKKIPSEEKSCRINSLRRNILNSQIKVNHQR